MAGCVADSSRAPVAFGRRAVPQLFEELQQQPEALRRLRALNSLCDLMHDPERIYQAVSGGNTELTPSRHEDQLSDSLKDILSFSSIKPQRETLD